MPMDFISLVKNIMTAQNVKAGTLEGIQNFVYDLGVHLFTRAYLYLSIFLFCHMKYSSIQ